MGLISLSSLKTFSYVFLSQSRVCRHSLMFMFTVPRAFKGCVIPVKLTVRLCFNVIPDNQICRIQWMSLNPASGLKSTVLSSVTSKLQSYRSCIYIICIIGCCVAIGISGKSSTIIPKWLRDVSDFVAFLPPCSVLSSFC